MGKRQHFFRLLPRQLYFRINCHVFWKTIEGFPVWRQNAFQLHHHAMEQAVGEPCFFFLSIYFCQFCLWGFSQFIILFLKHSFSSRQKPRFHKSYPPPVDVAQRPQSSVCSAKWNCQSTSDINVQKSNHNLWNHTETKGVLAKQLVFPQLGKLKSVFFLVCVFCGPISVLWGEKGEQPLKCPSVSSELDIVSSF